MSVVIGQIEVTPSPEAAPPAAGGGREHGNTEQKPADAAREIDKALHKRAQRSRRLWAY